MRKGNKIIRFFKLIYIKLFRINDSPSKVAAGFALGVSLGILPATGPIASIVLALFFRINRAAALLGSLLTNTWLSFVTFIFAVKIGAWMYGLNWLILKVQLYDIPETLNLGNVLSFSMLKIMLPLMSGYFVVALACGVISYLILFPVIIFIKRKKSKL